MPMSDHQDSENFSYQRTWKEINDMRKACEARQNFHLTKIQSGKLNKKQMVQHMRDYKGLQGAIYGLRYALGDLHMSRAMVLGDE